MHCYIHQKIQVRRTDSVTFLLKLNYNLVITSYQNRQTCRPICVSRDHFFECHLILKEEGVTSCPDVFEGVRVQASV